MSDLNNSTEGPPVSLEYPFAFRWGQPVRFVGGKYNGFQGTVRWVGQFNASVEVVFENKPTELIEETRHLQDLAEWKASRSVTEVALKSN